MVSNMINNILIAYLFIGVACYVHSAMSLGLIICGKEFTLSRKSEGYKKKVRDARDHLLGELSLLPNWTGSLAVSISVIALPLPIILIWPFDLVISSIRNK